MVPGVVVPILLENWESAAEFFTTENNEEGTST
jgi:hypothetical protein